MLALLQVLHKIRDPCTDKSQTKVSRGALAQKKRKLLFRTTATTLEHLTFTVQLVCSALGPIFVSGGSGGQRISERNSCTRWRGAHDRTTVDWVLLYSFVECSRRQWTGLELEHREWLKAASDVPAKPLARSFEWSPLQDHVGWVLSKVFVLYLYLVPEKK